MRYSKRSAVLLLLTVLIAVAAGAQEEADMAREHQLKAAFLFNFIKFVEWPAGVLGERITVCFAGGAGVQESLATGVNDKKVAGKPIQVRRVELRAGAGACDVLYLGADLVKREEELPVIGSGPRHMLTVSDRRNFAGAGEIGMIEIFNENNKLRFNINLQVAQKAGLHVSSNLLALAARVEQGDRK